MNIKKIKLYTIFVTITLIACQNNDVHFQYQQIPPIGWDKDSTITLQTIAPIDTTPNYNIYIHIRHQSQYPYQNLWLFAKQIQHKYTQYDTIHTYLADEYGKWLGTGTGSLREKTILYKKNIKLTDSIYTLKIKQGMRENKLKGIQEIGLRIEKTKQ